MHVVGTAGHVDHGKSSLVRALTGTDPDRWIEERLRGMTLDLGFAHLRFDDGVEAGIVDVPGHERFLHNMLAGAAGMDVLLLVVAANEGVRPQTVEHLAILDFLNVRRAIVVLTKRDLVDAETLAAAERAVRAATRDTVAQDAPVLAVSTVTGEGLDALRDAIHAALVALPPRPADAPAFLPVDRVFALPGHGTIVTGTLMQGTLRDRRHAAARPARARRARALAAGVRRGARHGRRRRARGGQRPRRRRARAASRRRARGRTRSCRARRCACASARCDRCARALLRRRTPVRAYLGAAEMLGTLVFDPAPPVDAAPVDATLHLRRTTTTYPGEAFVVRALSPKTLLGGGTVDAGAAPGSDESVAPDVAAIARALAETGARAAHGGGARRARERARGARRRSSRRARRARRRTALEQAARVRRRRSGRRRSRSAFVRPSRAAKRKRRGCSGTTSLALARELAVDEAFIVRVLASDADDGRITARAGYYATLDHRPQLTAEQRAFFERAVPADPAQPLDPAALEDVVAALRAARITGLPQAFDTLVATGALVKVGADVYRGTQIAEIRKRLEVGRAARRADHDGALPRRRRHDAQVRRAADGMVRRDGRHGARRRRARAARFRYALTGANIASCSRRSFHTNDESSNATSSAPIGWSAGTSCNSFRPCARPIGTSLRSRAVSAVTHVPYTA